MEARKFMFDRSFDVETTPKPAPKVKEAAPEKVEPEVVVPTFSEEELNAARGKAFAEGKEEGRMEATASTEREVLVALNGIGDRLKDLTAAQEKANASVMENAIAVAVSIARKVFPALNERHGFAEIERMVTTAIGRILEEPKVVIYVNGKLTDPIRERLAPIAAKTGFKGEISVEGLDDIIVGDARVEWMGGGAKRDLDALWREIDAIIERNLAVDAPAAAGEGLESAAESGHTTGSGEHPPAGMEAGSGGAILDAKSDHAGAGKAGPDSPTQGPAAPGTDRTPTDRGDR
jgi:flagellar biosynthesis/type III secretory pathway protein FliH